MNDVGCPSLPAGLADPENRRHCLASIMDPQDRPNGQVRSRWLKDQSRFAARVAGRATLLSVFDILFSTKCADGLSSDSTIGSIPRLLRRCADEKKPAHDSLHRH